MIKVNSELSPAFKAAKLTPIQSRVLKLHLEGLTAKQIAEHSKDFKINITRTNAQMRAIKQRFEAAFSSKNLLATSLKHGLALEINTEDLSSLLQQMSNLTKSHTDYNQKQALEDLIKGTKFFTPGASDDSAFRSHLKRVGQNLELKNPRRQILGLIYAATLIASDADNPPQLLKTTIHNPEEFKR